MAGVLKALAVIAFGNRVARNHQTGGLKALDKRGAGGEGEDSAPSHSISILYVVPQHGF